MFCFTAVLCMGCKQAMDAQFVIDESIKISGGALLNTSDITFNFRDKHYKAKRDHGAFSYERSFVTSNDSIRDILSNTDFKRFVNGTLVAIPDSMAIKYSSSVNSVHYFSVLPFGLNDPAVNKAYLGRTAIHGHDYHKVEVTFNQDGGGEDFEDVFVYWINTETYKVDYLAYSYEEDDGVGLRFREAYNERYMKGIRFVDYINYKSVVKNANLLSLDSLYQNNGLKELSRINLEQIHVK